MVSVAHHEIYAAMKAATINGVPMTDVIGRADPEKVALRVLNVVETLGPKIEADSHILDWGCGCGRMAPVLTERISEKGRYVGIDIVPGLIEFARRTITPGYPNFEFFLWVDRNPHYERFMTQAVDAPVLNALPLAAFDLVLAASLFTHLDALEAKEIWRQMARTLKPNGRVMATCFFLDDDAQQHIEAGKADANFRRLAPSGLAQMENPDDPTMAIAFTAPQLANVLKDTGLRLVAREPGNWMGAPRRRIYQDMLYLIKE